MNGINDVYPAPPASELSLIEGEMMDKFLSYAEFAFIIWAIGSIFALFMFLYISRTKGVRTSTARLILLVIFWPLILFLE